jgi:hypothetical protein
MYVSIMYTLLIRIDVYPFRPSNTSEFRTHWQNNIAICARPCLRVHLFVWRNQVVFLQSILACATASSRRRPGHGARYFPNCCGVSLECRSAPIELEIVHPDPPRRDEAVGGLVLNTVSCEQIFQWWILFLRTMAAAWQPRGLEQRMAGAWRWWFSIESWPTVAPQNPNRLCFRQPWSCHGSWSLLESLAYVWHNLEHSILIVNLDRFDLSRSVDCSVIIG